MKPREIGRYLLPEEVVLINGMIPPGTCCMQSRLYETSIYRRGDQILDIKEVSTGPGFRGLYHEDCLFMQELYESDGDDGHVDHRLLGYLFLFQSERKEIRRLLAAKDEPGVVKLLLSIEPTLCAKDMFGKPADYLKYSIPFESLALKYRGEA